MKPTNLKGCSLLTGTQTESLAEFRILDAETLIATSQVEDARDGLALLLGGSHTDLQQLVSQLATLYGIDPGEWTPLEERPMGLRPEVSDEH